jgi:hypothetical protein
VNRQFEKFITRILIIACAVDFWVNVSENKNADNYSTDANINV